IARVRAQLPNADLPLTQRNAQLVIAREYGFAGWQDLTAEVSKRLSKGLEWAVARARRIIHDNDVKRLKQLLAEYPALRFWQGNDSDGGLLGIATVSYGDSFDAAIAATLTFGLAPALRMSQVAPQDGLRETGRSTAGARSHRFQHSLIVIEIALAVVLLTSGSQLLETLQHLRNTDLGIRSEKLLSFELRCFVTRTSTGAWRS